MEECVAYHESYQSPCPTRVGRAVRTFAEESILLTFDLVADFASEK